MKRPEKDISLNVKESLTNHVGLAGVPVYHHTPQIRTNMYVYIRLTRLFEHMYMYVHICIFKDVCQMLPLYVDIYCTQFTTIATQRMNSGDGEVRTLLIALVLQFYFLMIYSDLSIHRCKMTKKQ